MRNNSLWPTSDIDKILDFQKFDDVIWLFSEDGAAGIANCTSSIRIYPPEEAGKERN
jgi:hypothetical protein